VDDFAQFELRIKEQGAQQAAAAMQKLEKSLKDTAKTAQSFDASKFWKQELAQIDKLERAQNRVLNFARKQAGVAPAKRGGIGSATEAGLVAGATTFGLGLAEEALKEIASLGIEAVKSVAELGLKFGEAAAEASAFAERSQLAIGFLTHDMPGARAAFDDVRQEAQSLGLNVEETVGSFQRMLAMQFSVGQSKDLIKLGGDLQAVGADAEHVQRLLYAITEIKGLGTLQQRQVRMLEMAGVSGELINEALAKRLGVTTTAQVKKLQKKGQIDAATAIDAIEEAVRHKVGETNLGEAGTKFAQTTITGQVNAAKAKVENFMISIGEAITPVEERLLGKGLKLLDRALESPQLASFGQLILSDLTHLADWTDSHWAEITASFDTGFNDIVSGAQWLYSELSSTLDFVTTHWDEIIADTKEVGVNVWNLVAPFVAVTDAVITLVGWWEKLFELSDRTGDAIGSFLGLDTKFGHETLGYESNAERKKRERETSPDYERDELEKNRAATIERQRAMGLLPGLTIPGIQPALPPRNVADLSGTRGGQGVASKTVNVSSLNVNVQGVEHGGNPAAAGEIVGNRTRAEILRMLEEG
jgi:tape measure domain-containing protein